MAVIAYYSMPSLQTVSERAADFKARGGYPFSALAAVFASLVLPELAKRITRTAQRIEPRELVFRIGFFAVIGVIVDALYRFLAMAMGTSHTWDVVLRKLLFDQFVFAPFVAIPFAAIAFLWRDVGFRFKPTMSGIRTGEFAIRYIPMLITCWAFWIPTLIAIFSMPSRLQFVLYLLTQAAWSLLLIHMGEKAEGG